MKRNCANWILFFPAAKINYLLQILIFVFHLLYIPTAILFGIIKLVKMLRLTRANNFFFLKDVYLFQYNNIGGFDYDFQFENISVDPHYNIYEIMILEDMRPTTVSFLFQMKTFSFSSWYNQVWGTLAIRDVVTIVSMTSYWFEPPANGISKHLAPSLPISFL